MKNIAYLLVLVCSLVLLSCTSLTKNEQDSRFSASLNWGVDPLTSRPRTKNGLQRNILIKKELKNIMYSAQKELVGGDKISAVDRIEKEGTLNSDPKHMASDKALNGTESILKWAICAAAGTQPSDQQCFDAAYSGIMKWINLYQPTGNSINDNQLLRLFLAIDLIMDKLSIQDQDIARHWLKNFIIKGDQFFANRHDGLTVNNWTTWRLAIRSLAGVIIQDNKTILETKKLIEKHVKVNLSAPLNWIPDQHCPNNENEIRYGGYDFRGRDALHYHVYNLEAWMWIAIFTPEVIEQQTIDSLNAAFQFLKPYYVGEKGHVEFVCSQIKFDRERNEAGQPEFQYRNWDPRHARKLLRMARPRFSTIRDWSKNVVDENYQSWVKLLAVTQDQAE